MNVEKNIAFPRYGLVSIKPNKTKLLRRSTIIYMDNYHIILTQDLNLDPDVRSILLYH